MFEYCTIRWVSYVEESALQVLQCPKGEVRQRYVGCTWLEQLCSPLMGHYGDHYGYVCALYDHYMITIRALYDHYMITI